MCSNMLLFFFVILCSAIFYKAEAGPWTCTPCTTPSECETPPLELCKFGELRDGCNRRICAKGPGERCGGPQKFLGECGEGLMCKTDERCHGCSIDTLQCYPQDRQRS